MFFLTHQIRLRCQRFISIVLPVLLIHACGFQLRGSLDLSQDMSPIYLQQNSVFELGREIEFLLLANKIQITENAKQSNAQLSLLNEAKSRRILSVDSNGRAREYLLNYTVNFSIIINQPDKPETTPETNGVEDSISHDSISVARSLLFDPDAVLAVTNESEILYKDMQRDVARLILLKLQASSHQNANMDSDNNKLQ